MLNRQIVVIGERPTRVFDTSRGKYVDIPENYEIWNAPRPVFGELVWTDTNGRTGWFHGAINPDSKTASNLRDANIRLDARRLFYLSVEACARRQFAHLSQRYDADEIRLFYDDEFLAAQFIDRVNYDGAEDAITILEEG